jgi:tetratricopeptide (TPR) repeat protein
MLEPLEFYDQDALIYRLSDALRHRKQDVVFLVGSPLSAPVYPGRHGVPTVATIIDMIRDEFAADAKQLAAFLATLAAAGSHSYQAAFKFLIGRKGQDLANVIVQRAVIQARSAPYLGVQPQGIRIPDEECRALEAEHSGWELSPALRSLAHLINEYPELFGRALLTTNFDPLIQQAVNVLGGRSYRTTLQSDGNLAQTEAEGCHIIHLHGYWWGSDTLHTAKQLTQHRPRLKASLLSLLRNKLLVVCGYGGWDDVFTSTLVDLVRDDAAAPEILWTFLSLSPRVADPLFTALQAGISRGRVSLYEGIDCNLFLPLLLASWQAASPKTTPVVQARSNPVVVSLTLRTEIETRAKQQRLIEGDEEDRPPQFDLCLGRDQELGKLKNASARVIFVTGIGGQGKSTLAAAYFSRSQSETKQRLFIWRDCKEESERFENQLAAVIERLSEGEVSGTDIARQDIHSIVDLLIGYITKDPVLFVFDNVDHYVDLETHRLTSSADILVTKLLNSHHESQVVFTCRPIITYAHGNSLSLELAGLSGEAALELFRLRGATATNHEVAIAHQFTNGHAFWLDLLAIQTAKRAPALTLTALVGEIGELPEDTLTSIWSTLRDRERLVLRVLAEAVTPATEFEVAEYLRGHLSFNKASRGIRSLKAQNLVVVKKLHGGEDVIELHPLVRQFVRTRFSRVERKSFIAAIISVYRRFIGEHQNQLNERPSFTVLQHWTQKAELDVSAGNFADATTTLYAASNAFSTSAFSREYTRVVRLLLSSTAWVSEHPSLPGFDGMFKTHLENLAHLTEFVEADDLLDKYAMTVLDKDYRYAIYCHLRSFTKWLCGDFKSAVDWGRMGEAIPEQKTWPPEGRLYIKHTLALAQRDAGEPEIALEFFLRGHQLGKVVDPDELHELGGGPFYGNVGRCLHFMGQTEAALSCYQKSALLIERDLKYEHVLNQGYIRRWIGELLFARGQRRLGSIFLEAARRRWEKSSPIRERQLRELQLTLGSYRVPVEETDEDLELTFRRWIMGDYLDDAT